MNTTRIEELLDAMTLEEQVSLLSGADFWTTVPIPRLGVPAFKVTDGPNGARGGIFKDGPSTACFPVGIALGATWNPALIEEVGAALGAEAKLKGARVLLAPTVNLQRTVYNGRNFECYSEDPWLSSELAVAYVRGLQSTGVAATIKHYAGNESEHQRMSMSSEIPERALRELYLLPFERAVKEAGVMAVMTGYNRVDGSFMADHRRLVTEVLREEWGFAGLVMSDWGAEHDTVQSVLAGCDLEMPGPTRERGDKLVAAVRDGRLAADAVRACARRVLQLADRLGSFADPGKRSDEAFLKGDAAALPLLFTDDAVLVNDTGPIYGRQAIERYYADMFQILHYFSHDTTYDPTSPHPIGSDGNGVWENGEWSSAIAPRGEDCGPRQIRGYFASVNVREGDHWKIRMLTSNVAPARPQQASQSLQP